jgi:hypothetical protein
MLPGCPPQLRIFVKASTQFREILRLRVVLVRVLHKFTELLVSIHADSFDLYLFTHFSSLIAGAPAGGRRDGSKVHHSTDRAGASASLRLSPGDGGTATA